MISVRPATRADVETVAAILTGAAHWLTENGMTMWRDNELLPERWTADVEAGLVFLAEKDGAPAGTIKFQLEDNLFWPDVSQEDSAFVHRLAVPRWFSGGMVSATLLEWAADRARSLRRSYLRLDCEVSRPKLRAVYERLGFKHHSDRQVGPYYVARYERKLD